MWGSWAAVAMGRRTVASFIDSPLIMLSTMTVYAGGRHHIQKGMALAASMALRAHPHRATVKWGGGNVCRGPGIGWSGRSAAAMTVLTVDQDLRECHPPLGNSRLPSLEIRVPDFPGVSFRLGADGTCGVRHPGGRVEILSRS